MNLNLKLKNIIYTKQSQKFEFKFARNDVYYNEKIAILSRYLHDSKVKRIIFYKTQKQLVIDIKRIRWEYMHDSIPEKSWFPTVQSTLTIHDVERYASSLNKINIINKL